MIDGPQFLLIRSNLAGSCSYLLPLRLDALGVHLAGFSNGDIMLGVRALGRFLSYPIVPYR